MSKFRVGDKVEIVDPIFDYDNKYKGFLVTISKTLGVDRYEVLENPRPWCDSELKLVVRAMPILEYIDDTMDTSDRPVVDLSDHAVDSLYPNMVDMKTWKNAYDKYVCGIWENKEEKDMNKVLKVWYERKRDKVIDEYKEKEVEFYNNRYSVVESFNALVEQFNEDLESLYKMDKVTEQFVLTENAPNNVIKYRLDLDKLKEEFEVEYLIKRNEELKEIEDIRIEVEAQLSLSDDLKYQQEVLERYGIISKKTKKIVG